MMNLQLLPFQYAGIVIKEAVYIGGTSFFTRRSIGEYLGYSNPQKTIDKIIERNPHIENSEWATTVKLTGVEGYRIVDRDTRVYNPVGLQLIVFESNQPRAIDYKIAVARLVSDMISREYDLKVMKECTEELRSYRLQQSN